MLENLKAIYWTGAKHSPYDADSKYRSYNRWIRLATCFGLLVAGYLLFLITDGFPPRAWRLLFDVVPRLQSLWADQGFGILLPLVGLLLLSFSLLVLWGLIVFGISHAIVHLWPNSDEQESLQTDLDESALPMQQKGQEPAQPQIRLRSAYTTPTQRDIHDESAQRMQPMFEQQSSQPMQQQAYQSQQSLSQQIQPLRGAVPTYEPLATPRQGQTGRNKPQAQGPQMRHTGTQHTHLRLIPNQKETVQNFPAGPDGEAQDVKDLERIQALTTRPGDVSDEITKPPYAVWNEKDEEQATNLRLVIGIGLDPGLVRKDRPNEDSLFAIQGVRITKDGPVPAGLFVVADGMGGHANGAEASRLAVREMSNCIVPALLRDDSHESRDKEEEEEFFLNLLSEGVYQANLAIHERNLSMPHMMGTTITTAIVVDTTAYVINVGDSRTYFYRAADGLEQVTRDHSTVARLVEEGEIERDEIYTHPQRNQIYRCLGEHPEIELDTFVVPLEPDDILLLCSDGLWEMVRDPVMEKIIASSLHQPGQISNVLVQAALNQGGGG